MPRESAAAHRHRSDEAGRLDLRTLELAPGAAKEFRFDLPLGEIALAGQVYRAEPAESELRLEVSQSASGRHVRLLLGASVAGPCWRCLEDARIPLDVDVRDFQAFGRPPGSPFDEDLDCEYLHGDELDVLGMARDGLMELLPPAILCREDCAGLCPTCGVDRNSGSCSCPPPEPDARWAPLGDLAERLRGIR